MPKTYLLKVDQQYAYFLREINGYLKEKGLTVERLATMINMDRSSLSRKLRNKTPLTLYEYLKIADALGININIFSEIFTQ